MKVCTACKEAKPVADFPQDRRRPIGLKAECKKCTAARHRAYCARVGFHKKRYQRLAASERQRHLMRKYGVDLADYERMYAAQDGKCAICRKAQKRAFDVDHDHKTGRVRGLLCTSCNRMLGHAGDSAATLRAGAAYLEGVPQVAAEFIGAFMECAP